MLRLLFEHSVIFGHGLVVEQLFTVGDRPIETGIDKCLIQQQCRGVIHQG